MLEAGRFWVQERREPGEAREAKGAKEVKLGSPRRSALAHFEMGFPFEIAVLPVGKAMCSSQSKMQNAKWKIDFGKGI
jgi:hypothetical protein